MTYGDCKTNKLICNIAQSFWHREPILRQWQALSATFSLQINSNNMAFKRFKFFCRVVYVMEIFSLSIALSSRFLFFYREKLFTHTTTYKAIYFPKVPDCFFSQHKNAITLSKAHFGWGRIWENLRYHELFFSIINSLSSFAVICRHFDLILWWWW